MTAMNEMLLRGLPDGDGLGLALQFCQIVLRLVFGAVCHADLRF
jgi:hypothetical protein